MAGGGKGTATYKSAQRTRKANARAAAKSAKAGTDYMGKQRAAVAAKAAAVKAMPKGGAKALRAAAPKGENAKYMAQQKKADAVMSGSNLHKLPTVVTKSPGPGGHFASPKGHPDIRAAGRTPAEAKANLARALKAPSNPVTRSNATARNARTKMASAEKLVSKTGKGDGKGGYADALAAYKAKNPG